LSEHEYELEQPLTLVERLPSFAPLAFGAVGLLGLLLDSEEKEAAHATPTPVRKKTGGGQVKRIRIRV
jgi:hypothetical protein